MALAVASAVVAAGAQRAAGGGAPAGPGGGAAGRFYRPELDALRLFAFLMVWIAHTLPDAADGAAHGVGARLLFWVETVKDAGNFGVCVFFFLSAYLITELLQREQRATGTVHLAAFYLRRVLRIWPLYLGVLLAYGVLGLRWHAFRIEPGRLLASVLLAGNWYIAAHPAILTPMRALWSLSVEEQFYLGWPVLVRQARPAAMMAACAALIALALGTVVWLARSGQPMLHVTAWVNSVVQFQFFALGGLVALLLGGRQPRLTGWARSLLLGGAAGALLLAAGGCGIKRPWATHDALTLVAGYALVGLGCVLLFVSVLGVDALRVPAWAVRLGQVSFGLYVFHEPGFSIANALEKHLFRGAAHERLQQDHWALLLAGNKLVSLGVTVLLALASYQWWERPFLRLKDRFAFVHTRRA
ncbi:MAG TPA: acyltransferase [Acidobacteriaceae bacterium]